MSKLAEEETAKAWEALISKKNSKEKANPKLVSKSKTSAPPEKKEESKGKPLTNPKTEEMKIEEDKQAAAAWLTGGLENEIQGPGVIAPSLASGPVESLDEFASIPSKKKEADDEDTRMYETKDMTKYDPRREIYEETPENLFSRIVQPGTLNPIPRVHEDRTRFSEELRHNDLLKYSDDTDVPSGTLPFMKREAKEDIKKYRIK